MWLIQFDLFRLRVTLGTRYPREFTELDVAYWLKRNGFERIDVDEYAYTGDPWRVVPNADVVIKSCRKM